MKFIPKIAFDPQVNVIAIEDKSEITFPGFETDGKCEFQKIECVRRIEIEFHGLAHNRRISGNFCRNICVRREREVPFAVVNTG